MGEPGIPGPRATTAWLLAGLMLSLVLGLTGCGAGGGSDSATRPTTERSGTRPEPSGTESPSETTTEPTRPPRTTADTPASTRTPTTVERPNSPTTTPEARLRRWRQPRPPRPRLRAHRPRPSPRGWAPRLDPAHPPGCRAGWRLAALEVAQEVGLDAQAAALEQDTRTATGTQLPPVLTAEDAGQRALSWPPLRAELVDLMRRWDLLAERAPDNQRRNRSGPGPQPPPGVGRGRGRRERGAGDRAGLAASAAAGRPGRAGAVRSPCWRTATGASCGRGALAARARRMTTSTMVIWESSKRTRGLGCLVSTPSSVCRDQQGRPPTTARMAEGRLGGPTTFGLASAHTEQAP